MTTATVHVVPGAGMKGQLEAILIRGWLKSLPPTAAAELAELLDDEPEVAGDWAIDHGGEGKWAKRLEVRTTVAED